MTEQVAVAPLVGVSAGRSAHRRAPKGRKQIKDRTCIALGLDLATLKSAQRSVEAGARRRPSAYQVARKNRKVGSGTRPIIWEIELIDRRVYRSGEPSVDPFCGRYNSGRIANRDHSRLRFKRHRPPVAARPCVMLVYRLVRTFSPYAGYTA